MLSFFSLQAMAQDTVKLPNPQIEGGMSVEQAIHERKSIRSFSDVPLTLEQVSQILWSAGGATVDGVTGPTRAYPSAGAVYPLEIYIVAGNVTGLEPGVYRYDWKEQALKIIKKGDVRPSLATAAFGQAMVQQAPVTVVITALYEKVSSRYGEDRAVKFVSMDAGHLGQNVHLEAQSLGLGTVMVGAFTPQEVSNVIGVEKETPVYMMPVGRPKQ